MTPDDAAGGIRSPSLILTALKMAIPFHTRGVPGIPSLLQDSPPIPVSKMEAETKPQTVERVESISEEAESLPTFLAYANPAGGYDRLGQLMGELPETTAFRRFGALSAEDLLYRQAELVELERSLREYQQEDKESGHEDRERYAFNWEKLRRGGDDDAPDGNDGIQWETILEIREKLKDYRTPLLFLVSPDLC